MSADTAAIRAEAADAERRGGRYINVRTDTVRALCDAADDVQRLRQVADEANREAEVCADERDAARTAHAALVAGLRAHALDAIADPLTDDPLAVLYDALTLLDRHAPEATP